MENIAKIIMLAGGVIFLVGLLVFVFNKFGFPLGNLPGDIYIERENTTFYFPITSFILISVIISLVANIILKFFKG